MNRWSRLPTTGNFKDDRFDSFSINSDEYNESESLMSSQFSLPKITRTNNTSTNYNNPSIKSNDKQIQIKRITKELIDDEIPLIKI